MGHEDAVAVFRGGHELSIYDSDTNYDFVQEANFMYLFGADEPGFLGAIDLLSGAATLFVPRLPEDYAVWLGPIHKPEHFRTKYMVDEALFVDELRQWLKRRRPGCVHILSGVNSDSGLSAWAPAPADLGDVPVSKDRLYHALCECRVYKSAAEVDLMRYVNRISSEAHKRVMCAVRPGMMEYELSSMFMHEVYAHGGCRLLAYLNICCSGHDCSTLHYVRNDKRISDGDMCLFDMGAQYFGYCSDITCSFPANGRFTQEQRAIYSAVLAAQQAVERSMRPGVLWSDMHLLAERVMLQHLSALGIVRGALDELMAASVGALFMPHGLGHLLGLNVHDVGGYLPSCPPRIEKPGIRRLRTARVLAPGMVLTVEPGIYFIPALLDPALRDPTLATYLNEAVLATYRGVGGVRLEDDVLVCEDGIENLTTVPRSIEEIEALMASGRDGATRLC